MDPLERVHQLKRDKLFGLKTCLKAAEKIPPGAFLFYNLSEGKKKILTPAPFFVSLISLPLYGISYTWAI